MTTSGLAIDAISVGPRHRQDLGDLSDLMASIRELGLLHPIVITGDHRLVAGIRRLEACRQLGLTEVPVHVVANLTDAVPLLRAERDENTCRLDMTPGEKVALGRELEKLERPKAKERQGRPGRERSENVTEHKKGETREIVGSAIGMSGPTYQRAKAVVMAAEQGDPVAIEALGEMNETGRVRGAYKKLTDVSASPKPRPRVPQRTARCEWCGKEFHPRDKNVRFCSRTCPSRMHHGGKGSANEAEGTLRRVTWQLEAIAEGLRSLGEQEISEEVASELLDAWRAAGAAMRGLRRTLLKEVG